MSTFRHAATLNIVGLIVLVVGIGCALCVYRLGQNQPATSSTQNDWRDSSLSPMDSKVSTRDIELYGGKVEILIAKSMDWLQQPKSLAILIAVISVFIALGCFLVARQLLRN